MKRFILLALLIGCSITQAACSSRSTTPTFVGTVSSSYETDNESGTISLYQPVDGETWAYRVARCEVSARTVFVQPNYREVAAGVGGFEDALAAVEGSVVSVTGAVQGSAIACAEVSMTADAPVQLPWEAERSGHETTFAIPTPLPPGKTSEVSGSVVMGGYVGSDGGAWLGVVDGPIDEVGQSAKPIARIQYFLVDSSTMLVEGSERRPVTADDIEELYTEVWLGQVSTTLLVTDDAAYAKEIRRLSH